MWLKIFLTALLFYFFVILQNSFFIHFSFFGSVPDFVFILFFCYIFFEKKDDLQLILLSAVAGLFLDVFSSAHIGTSVILLIIVGFLAKKVQIAFKETKDSRPFSYFIPLFAGSFIIYKLLVEAYFWFFTSTPFSSVLQMSFFAAITYNLVVSSVFFYVFKKIYKK